MVNRAGLLEDSSKYIGKPLLVSPIYGWGWSDDQPRDFEIVLLALQADSDGLVKGGYGRITERRHKYEGHFAVFSLHHMGLWNFTD